MVRYLFPKSNIGSDTELSQSMPHTKKSKKIYDKAKYIKILNKSYKDILLSADEISFLETIPRKKLIIILNINRNNRSFDKLDCLSC
jgi:hypothetical protein